MWFRRRVRESAQWVAVAQDSTHVHAAQVAHTEGERPRLLWLWTAETGNLSEGLTALKRAHALKGQPLVHQLERAQYRLLSTEVPDVPREEWNAAMRWRLQEQVDFPMEDALLDVIAVPQDTQLRQMFPAIALVMQRGDYVRLTLAADDVGVRWSAIDTAETALRNLSAMAEVEGQAHALLVFGESHGVLVITYQGELLMTRNIEVAVSAVTGSNEARGAALGRAALEVLRTLDTFERMHSQATLSGLSVVPPKGGDADVLEVLADLVYVPIKYFSLTDCIDVSALGDGGEQLTKAPSLSELCVIGSALRAHSESAGRQSVNLLDPEATKSKSTWSATWGLVAAGGVLGVAILAGAGFTATTSYIQRRIQFMEQDMVDLRKAASTMPPMADVTELASLRKTEARQKQMYEALKNTVSAASAPGYSDYMLALGRQSQPSLWITGFVLRDEGRNLELTGRMTDNAALPLYLMHLQVEERFRGRRFAQVELRSLNSGKGTGNESDSGPAVTEFILRSRDSGGSGGAAAPAAAPLDPGLQQLAGRH